METSVVQEVGHEKHQVPVHNLFILTIIGGIAFWLTNLAISLTPIAAEYRAALSISYYPMLAESMIGGLVIAFVVSFIMLRFYAAIPTKNATSKSMVLSISVLVIVTVLLEGPARFLMTDDPWRYFLIGGLFNVLRIMALGVAIGLALKRV